MSSGIDWEELDDFRFHLIDYLVFGSMLVLSAGVGVYFAYFGKPKKQSIDNESSSEESGEGDFGSKSMLEYLLGSRNMNALPVAFSLIAGYISGVTVLGTPSEIYYLGIQYWVIIVGIFFMGFVVSYVYLPVYFALRVNSSYEVEIILRK